MTLETDAPRHIVTALGVTWLERAAVGGAVLIWAFVLARLLLWWLA